MDNWSERMNIGRLIEVLQKVFPDTEVMCCIVTEELPTGVIVTLSDLKGIQKYELKSVLTKPNDNEYCTLLIKNLKSVKKTFINIILKE